MGMLPKVGPFANLPKNPEIDEKRLRSVEAIINSMTAKERENANLIDGKRRKRIALGSGTSVQEVNQVLKQYAGHEENDEAVRRHGQNQDARPGQIRRPQGLLSGRFIGPQERRW